jgi:hypothetical protein
MNQLVQEMLREKTWAVVGASANPQKYGYKVYKRLLQERYNVYAVNPNCKDIEGVPCYPELSRLPEVPGVVSVIVPPAAGIGVLEEAAVQGIKRLWFQPGAESSEIIDKADRIGLEIVHHKCVLVELG